MNKYSLVALSVAAGILSGLAWTDWFPGVVLLAGLAPYFIIENHIFENRDRYNVNSFFIYLLPGFLVFCLISLGWVRVATIAGAVFIVMGLTFLMAFTMWLAHSVRLAAGNLPGLISLVAFWLTFEFICLNSDILTPWLILGNGFAKEPEFIQWYELTGTAGGTLWILASNICLSGFLIHLSKKSKRRMNYLILWFAIILLPSALSLIRFYNIKTSNSAEQEVVIIQPNYDPYTEKFSIPFELQMESVLNMAADAATEQTRWIITPETTIDDPVDESLAVENKYITMIRDSLIRYPGAAFMIGMVSFINKELSPDRQGTFNNHAEAEQFSRNHYNSAFQIDTGPLIKIYHKSKLIPGIELQFPSITGKLITRFLPYLGGTNWGYVTQRERQCFEHPVSSIRIAPVICYESVYGRFITEYVKNGAEAIFIITNDGWWRFTNGYKQHLWYASLRAVETRRPVARAANTGISCFIDIRGKITGKTNWWQPAVMRGQITPEKHITPYVKYGDYLYIIASAASGVMLIIVFIFLPARRRIKQPRLRSGT